MESLLLSERSIIEHFGRDFTKEVAFKLSSHSQQIDGEFLAHLVSEFKASEHYKMIQAGYRYYDNEHDIMQRKRMGLDDNGQEVEIFNAPNNKEIDNQYKKCVDQKKNYLFGRPVTFDSDNKAYQAVLDQVFNKKRFPRTLKTLGMDAIIGGMSYLYPYLNDDGEVQFKVFRSHQGFPLWDDEDHTISPAFVRFYDNTFIEKNKEKTISVIELYTGAGIFTYHIDKSKPVFVGQQPYAWSDTLPVDVWGGRNPVIPFKFNAMEQPLLKSVKGLQDALNTMISTFADHMEEDSRNTLLVVKNYGGTDTAKLRYDLNRSGVILVETLEGVEGGVETLTIEVNAENYKVIIDLLRKAIVDNARGFDAKDERMSNNPNQMNIRSMYADIDLDASDMETEFQASFDELLNLLNEWSNSKFDPNEVIITFDRDILVNESEAIDNYMKSGGQGLSLETVTRNHPWDDGSELERILEEMKTYPDNTFPEPPEDVTDDDEEVLDK